MRKDEDENRYCATDDLTGMRLEGGKVVEARAREVEYIRDKQVWKKINGSEAVKRLWKNIETRWQVKEMMKTPSTGVGSWGRS